MGLMSFFKRGGPASADSAPATAPDDVAAARSRARRRLIGAAVLLAAGVIGFPLLFETQPRPVAVDIPIVSPDKDRVPPLVLSQAPAATVQVDPQAPGDGPAEVRERAGEQGREVLSPPAAPAPTTQAEPTKPEPGKPDLAAKTPKPDAAPPAAAPKPAAAAPEPAPQPRSAAKAEAARAQALLNGQPVAQADEARVVVQVGAFAEADAVRQTRAKLDKLGLKSYTQVVEVGGARRTRVRVGPFSNRAEADKAAARIKAAGLPAAILSL